MLLADKATGQLHTMQFNVWVSEHCPELLEGIRHWILSLLREHPQQQTGESNQAVAMATADVSKHRVAECQETHCSTILPPAPVPHVLPVALRFSGGRRAADTRAGTNHHHLGPLHCPTPRIPGTQAGREEGMLSVYMVGSIVAFKWYGKQYSV